MNKHHGIIMNNYDCGCYVESDGSGCYTIGYCPLHDAAPDMYEALKESYNYIEASAENQDFVMKIGKILSKAEGK